MKKVVVKRIIAGTAAAAAISAPLTLEAGSAGAVTVKQNPHSTTVWLNHQETVQAAQSGLASTLEQPAINPHTTTWIRADSRYYDTIHTVNGRPSSTVHKQQLVDEVAAKPNGQLGVRLSTDPNNIVEIVQYWPTAYGR
jgi:hypothetical protein